MEIDEQKIADRIQSNPPTCVSGFRLSTGELAEPVDAYFKTVYGLSCRCGGDRGMVLGYPLRDYAPQYGGTALIAPLFFKCGTCATETQIIDTALHGYHAEVGKLEGGIGSATLRGNGKALPFACPDCSAKIFSIVTAFVYWNFDIMFDEPELPGQDFFNEFIIHGRCNGCNKHLPIANLGKI